MGSAGPAAAVSLKLVSKKTSWAGVEVRHYTTTSPKTKLWLARIALCAKGVHVTATKAPSSLASTGSWAAKQAVKLATNGDFYKTGPVRVYGQAVGDGNPWPLKQTGVWSGYSWEWFYKKHGWIALLHDDVTFSHSQWIKKNKAKSWGLKQGWKPKTVTTSLPDGVVALVSGFPELVVEGKQVTCSSPTAKSCFPDRSDMRARHPRTAMGLTADRKTLLLMVVDGRTSISKGMYGAELAEVMFKLGAWEAFNVDGGGSSQMWRSGSGYLNNAKGNNMSSSYRSVANHWGVFAGSSAGKSSRPGHCVSSAPCQVLPPKGGVIDDKSTCFQTFGPPKYWRTEKAGFAGQLRWTNAFKTHQPSNWAWWRIHTSEAGTYRIDVHVDKKWSVHKAVHYRVQAKGKAYDKTVNPAGKQGWLTLGQYAFAKGGEQWLRIIDQTTKTVAKNQHIVADAIQVVRVGAWCGNKTCDGGETCKSCVTDCGACASCGDGKCNGGESCTSCKQDCGVCPPKCGDGQCNGAETCSSCKKDCGACPPSCGDANCNGDESCATCPADCGPCPPVDAGEADVGSSDSLGLADSLNMADSPAMADGNDGVALPDVVTAGEDDAQDETSEGVGGADENANDGLTGIDVGGTPDAVAQNVAGSSSGCTAGGGGSGRAGGWGLLLLVALALASCRRRWSDFSPVSAPARPPCRR